MSKEYTPLVIAKSFTKQYYEIIHKKPQQLYRFYKEESNFFHGDANESTETISGGDNIREKVESLNLAGAKVDLTDGSIDAQKSDNNAVFLVVTGKFTMPGKNTRPFFQSFFLVCQNGGKAESQPSYYVRNSVFRLFGEEVAAVPAVVTPPTPPVAQVTTAVFEKKEEVAVVAEVAPVKEEVAEEIAEVTSEEDDAAKTEVADTQGEDLDISTVTSEPDYVNVSVSVSAKKDTTIPATQTPAETVEAAPKEVKEVIPEPVVVKEKVKPASWACLFSGAGGAAAPEPVQEAPKVVKKVTPAVKKESDFSDKTSSAPKVTSPPLTLYLSQLPDHVVEAEVRALFEPFGAIKKVDIHAHKGFAFVDFAEASSVKNAMAQKGTGLFVIRETAILVEERHTKGSMGAKSGSSRGGRGGVGSGSRQGGGGGQKSGGRDNKGQNNNRDRNKAGNKTGGAKPTSAK